MSLPSSVTTPALGFRSLDSPRSSVDFPQALAPTIMVTLPSGTSVESPSTTRRCSYWSVKPRALSCAMSGFLSVGGDQKPQQEWSAEGAGNDADRQDGAGQNQGCHVVREVVGREDDQGAGERRRREAGSADHPPGDRPGEEGDEGNRTGSRRRHCCERDGGDHQAETYGVYADS